MDSLNPVALLVLGACLLPAQNPAASLAWIVPDADGAMVPNASITVVHVESNQRRILKSGRSGG